MSSTARTIIVYEAIPMTNVSSIEAAVIPVSSPPGRPGAKASS